MTAPHPLATAHTTPPAQAAQEPQNRALSAAGHADGPEVHREARSAPAPVQSSPDPAAWLVDETQPVRRRSRRTKRADRRQAYGTTRQLRSGRWQARYTDTDGTRRPAPRTFATEREALDWITTHRAGHLTGQWRSPEVGAVALGEYAADYLTSRVDLAPRTQDNYRRQLDGLVCADLTHPAGRHVDLSGVLLRDLTPALVRDWHAAALHTSRQRAADRIAASDRRRRARALCAARTWALAQGLDVKRTGRLPAAVVEAWRSSGAPAVATYDLPDTEPPRDAGRVAVAHAYALLRSILATAHRDGLILANPCTVRGASAVAAPERPIATPAEVARLAQHMPDRFRAAVVVAAWSSLRASELFALTRAHVDLDRGTLRVERALLELPGQPIKFQQPKTRKSVRTVHLPAPVVEVLRAHLATHVPAGPDRLVFGRADGMPLRGADRSRMFRAACTEEGLHTLRWHDLRHTGATMFTQAGASLREVQARLGHSTAAAAMTYQHATPERDREVTDRMTARIAGLNLSNPQPSPLRVVG